MALLSHANEQPSRCPMRTAQPSTYIHPLKDNRWIMVLPREVVIDLECQERSQAVAMNGSGILPLEPGCSLRGTSVVIKATTTYKTVIRADVVPRFNLTQKTERRTLTFPANALEVEVSELQQTIQELKREEPWAEVDWHHIGNYTGPGAGLVLTLTLLLLGCRLWNRQRRQREKIRRQRHRKAETRLRARKET